MCKQIGESVNKKDFIQRCVSNAILLTNPSGDDVITRAEKYWDRLSKRGYGSSKAHKPRDTGKDWYKELSVYQKEWFDKFWKAYSLKRGKDGAAMRWYQLGEPAQNEYEKIVSAAMLEAKNRSALIAQNVTPMMAQGWLSNRRYADYAEPKANTVDTQAKERIVKIREVQADITHFSKMSGDIPKAEVAKLKKKLEALKKAK